MGNLSPPEDEPEQEKTFLKTPSSPQTPQEDNPHGADPFEEYRDPTDFGYYYGLPDNPKLLAKTNKNKGVQIAETMLDGTGIYRVRGKRAYEVDDRDPGCYKTTVEDILRICRTISSKVCLVEFLRLGYKDHPAMNPPTFLVTVEEGTSSNESKTIVRAIEKYFSR